MKKKITLEMELSEEQLEELEMEIYRLHPDAIDWFLLEHTCKVEIKEEKNK